MSDTSLKVCVLQPDYSTTQVDYKNYDPPRNLSSLLPHARVDHIFLNKLTTYKQLKELSKKNYSIFVNLCEGYLDWEVPSIDVIYFLELLQLPFTGPTSILYDPSKDLMKYVAYTQQIATPDFALINAGDDIQLSCSHLRYPLFVKPSKAGDSLGISETSLVYNEESLIQQVKSIQEAYGPILVEEYIEGREFTVMLMANAHDPKTVTVLQPVEYIFPTGRTFKTYALKTSELHPECNIAVVDEALVEQLSNAAKKIFTGFCGVGYARLDFRMNEKSELFFLEINFTCSVFYCDGMEGSADHILQKDGMGQGRFLELIIAEGIARHQQKKKKYTMKGNALSGYGIYANQHLIAGEIIFQGEETSQRMTTLSYVESNWPENEKENFRKYAYPISEEVFLLWDDQPTSWAPQNHSCQPNTAYRGLNVVTLHEIEKGTELTLDYAHFLDEHMEPFVCKCGSPQCRGTIKGIPGNSVTRREKLHRQKSVANLNIQGHSIK